MANFKGMCDPTKVNVIRRRHLTKGLHPAHGIPFASVHRVHAIRGGPRNTACNNNAVFDEEELVAEPPGIGLAELARLEAEYAAAPAMPIFAPSSPQGEDG